MRRVVRVLTVSEHEGTLHLVSLVADAVHVLVLLKAEVIVTVYVHGGDEESSELGSGRRWAGAEGRHSRQPDLP